MKLDENTIREAFAALHASEATRQEVLQMQEKNKMTRPIGRRVLTLAVAAVLVVALAAGVLAASGVFRMRVREAAPEEVFDGPSVTTESGETMTYTWKNAKLVFNFDGPDTCSRIRFKPGYLPYEVYRAFSYKDAEGWYSRLSCEGRSAGSDQPCLIEVRYAPMFVDDGNLLLLYSDEVSEIEEEEWNGFRVLKFQSVWANPNFPAGTHNVDCSYCVLYQPQEGYIITVSSMEDNLGELEQIAKSLEIEKTDELISSADYHGHNEFLTCGVG